MPATRSTIAFNEKNWSKIKDASNRSKLVNEAIDYFFNAKAFVKKKEEEFLLNEWQHYQKTGEHYTFDDTFSE